MDEWIEKYKNCNSQLNFAPEDYAEKIYFKLNEVTMMN